MLKSLVGENRLSQFHSTTARDLDVCSDHFRVCLIPYTDGIGEETSIIGDVSSRSKQCTDTPGTEYATGIATLCAVTDRSTTQIRNDNTKSGRCMFSSVQINVNGLENYYVFMEIAPASDHRHKHCGYQNGGENSNMGGWSFAVPAEPQQPFGYDRIYKYPESPATGSHWMDNPISFNKLKLTNNINDPNNNVVLTSMHKYVPRIWIIRSFDAKNYNELFTQSTALFAFKEMEFIAVTAY
ncbi:T-box protein 2 [Temnothorax longispinosus]|uniref:T-box protein 2 n=1 Tax=Temnothorax longispinosus TaxID=300112 RepID=A0A4S2KSU2_9HYME|nr:T-box protein 2 [Temnothorax longispinosus]